MRPELRAALVRCRQIRGSLYGYRDERYSDLYRLTLWSRSEREYAEYVLSGPEYLEAFTLWEQLLTPSDRKRYTRRSAA